MRYSSRTLLDGELNYYGKRQPYAPDYGEVSEDVIEDWMWRGGCRIVYVIEDWSRPQIRKEGSTLLSQRISDKEDPRQNQKESE